MEHWQERAACKGAPLKIFFPAAAETLSRKWEPYCSACPVVGECLKLAKATGSVGIFGGQWFRAPGEAMPIKAAPGRPTMLELGKCSAGHPLTSEKDVYTRKAGIKKGKQSYKHECLACRMERREANNARAREREARKREHAAKLAELREIHKPRCEHGFELNTIPGHYAYGINCPECALRRQANARAAANKAAQRKREQRRQEREMSLVG